MSNNISVRWADQPRRASTANLYRCALLLEVPLPGKKNWRQLAGAGSRYNARKIWGEGHRAKSLTGYALTRKVSHRGEEFPKPEHGGLCQVGLEIAAKKGGQPRNAATCDEVQLGSNHLGATAIGPISSL